LRSGMNSRKCVWN